MDMVTELDNACTAAMTDNACTAAMTDNACTAAMTDRIGKDLCLNPIIVRKNLFFDFDSNVNI